MKQKIIGILLAGISCLLLVVVIVGNLKKDTKSPQIKYPEENVPVYAEGQDTSVLLSDVTAFDKKDGDVTSDIVISNIYDFHDGTAKVIYAARDKSGNIAKKERIITYQANSEAQVVTASAQVVTDSGLDTDTSGTQIPTVTTEPQQANGENPVINLTQNQLTLKRGESFKKLDYVQGVTDNKDSESELYRRIQVSGTYDINHTGTYELSYSVTDSDGNKSDIAKLVLDVQ